ncbi:Growth arrest-specific protein 1 [Oryzias melastigma]|uniref:Growth arrest-specific protein 1 n=1 Tax=Oryzias melastigma TaxID=30732 RepID=A0A834KXP9_ORYME|nr:Growth arrest-specific protein 1 [Oryzias melastigma]
MFDEMISSSSLMERAPLLAWVVLILILGVCFGSPNPNHRLVCWKAIFKCHAEPECHYAYDQYLYACASVLSGERRKCPSHCISSLIQLNLTRSGPALEDCDCAADPRCRSTKQAIEPCVPRTSTMGCTEARLQCGLDPACSSAMKDYLFHCRKLFGGQMCTESCRRTIADMRSIPKAQQLDTCVCDGAERNICEYIKVSMRTLCFGEGSGFADSEEDAEDVYFDPGDYPNVENACASAPFLTLFHTLTIIVASKGI